MSSPLTTPKQDRLIAVIACGVVGFVFLAICVLVIRSPFSHNECPVYLRACWDWWHGRGLYDKNFGIDGFLYLPQFVLIFSPFAIFDPVLRYPVGNLPIEILAIGDCLWRAAALAMLLIGLWRACRIFAKENRLALFNLLLLMSFLPAIASLRNGQANLHIAGLMLLTSADLIEKKWSRAAFWLILGFFIKPVMAVMILLAAVSYRKMFPRLLIGIVAGLLLPFAFQKPHYVLNQYDAFFRTTLTTTAPDREFCNLHGLLAKFGCMIPPTPFQFISLAAAVLTLGVWLLANRREEPFRSFLLYALSGCYILLFNPRTESNSYVLIAPAIAIVTALAFFRYRNTAIAWLLVAIGICLICDAWAYHATENWLKPLVCLVFFILLVIGIFRRPEPQSEPQPAESMVGA